MLTGRHQDTGCILTKEGYNVHRVAAPMGDFSNEGNDEEGLGQFHRAA